MTDSPARGYAKPNHTQTPNTFFDDSLKQIKSLAELKIVLAVIRQTFGWQKDADAISVSQLERMTGLTRESVTIGIQSAIEHGFITRQPFKNTFRYSLVIVGNSDWSEKPTSQQFRPKTVGKTDHKVVGNSDPQKKGIKEKKERVRQAAPRDPLIDNPHVVSYRAICRLNPNAEQRQLIANAVTDAPRWESVLRKLMAEGRPPNRVDWALERYAKNGNGQSYVDAELARTMTPQRIRELRDGR